MNRGKTLQGTLLNWVLRGENAKIVWQYKNVSPQIIAEVTVVIPIFNQESVISSHLESIFANMETPFSAILVDDSSTDLSNINILKTLKIFANSPRARALCSEILFYKTRCAWFETRCDDFAFREAKTKYVIEIQADMKILEIGFDKKLIQQIKRNEDFIAISARGVHPRNVITKFFGSDISDDFFLEKVFKKVLRVPKKILAVFLKIKTKKSVENKEYKYLEKSNLEAIVFPVTLDEISVQAGWLGDLVEHLPYEFSENFQLLIHEHQTRIYSGETIMRGPIILDRDKYLELGGFNVRAFYQGDDDHDLWIRAEAAGLKVGFFPVYFSSPLALGNARKPRKINTKYWSKFNKSLRKNNYKESALKTWGREPSKF